MPIRFPTLLPLLGAIAFVAPVAAHDMFKTMDTNHDGKISAEEHAAGAKAMFDKMDADHDGKITAAECDAGHAKMEAEEKGEKGEHHMGMPVGSDALDHEDVPVVLPGPDPGTLKACDLKWHCGRRRLQIELVRQRYYRFRINGERRLSLSA